jgi:hypothetical protein
MPEGGVAGDLWLDSAVVRVQKLADAFREDACMVILFVCLLVTTVLLP